MGQVVCLNLGRAEYERTLLLQRRLVEQVAAAGGPQVYLILVEHDPPVITLGRRANDRNILASRQRLAAEGIEVHEASRGGDVTYHGPGQLVGYPILSLDRRGRDVHRYMRDLEEVIIRLLERLGISAARVKGRTGVWVGRENMENMEKVASIGIAVSRRVAYHGFSLNVSPNLDHFKLIVSCGIPDIRMTSISRLLGRDIPIAEVCRPLADCFAEVFGLDGVREGSASELLARAGEQR